MNPLFATYSPIYQQSTHQAEAIKQVYKFLAKDFPGINQSNCTTSFHDDLLVINKNHGFLSDPDFAKAVGAYTKDSVVMSKIWRIYSYAQQAFDATRYGGNIVDLGCYDCKTIEIVLRYIKSKNNSIQCLPKPNVFLFDAFDNPPTGKKAFHGPNLLNEVSTRLEYLEAWFNLTFVKGHIPNSLSHRQLDIAKDSINFIHIDLNNGELDAYCLKYFHEKLRVGGSIIFDDYGFANYKETMILVNKTAEELKGSVLEMPTGQGLFIKRI